VNQGAYNPSSHASYPFQAETVLTKLRAKCEESIAGELRGKLSEFLQLAEGLQWRPKKLNTRPNDYLSDTLAYLRSTVGCLPTPDLQKQSYTLAFSHIAARLTELLAQSKAIPALNQTGLLNLWLDT
jgi:hypothetical protein